MPDDEQTTTQAGTGAAIPVDQASESAAATSTVAEEAGISVRDLTAKGNGVLTRVGNVWTYPGCRMDPSGTNLRLPLEFVTDEAVRREMSEGSLVALTQSPAGRAMSIRYLEDGEVAPVISTAQAGTAEAGTELPVGSRPTHDAGNIPMTPEENLAAADRAGASLTGMLAPPAPPVAAGKGAKR